MKQEKYGFVYIWYDRKHKRYYIGCHWGSENDGYICSSNWMRDAYKKRPNDFKRRILTSKLSREQMYIEEQRFFNMIKPEELRVRYYNISLKNGNIWHQYPENVKTIGQKISHSKKGKSTGPCSPEKAKKISEAKKGIVFSEEHKQKLREAKVGSKHSAEWKQKAAERLRQQWSNGTRKRAEPKQIMSREEQAKLNSEKLKARWADPVWKENQIKRLSEGAKKRPPRTEESKYKTSLSVKETLAMKRINA